MNFYLIEISTSLKKLVNATQKDIVPITLIGKFESDGTFIQRFVKDFVQQPGKKYYAYLSRCQYISSTDNIKKI